MTDLIQRRWKVWSFLELINFKKYNKCLIFIQEIMENKKKKVDKLLPPHKEENISADERVKNDTKDFPGYPHYPASEDIYNKEEEVDLNPDDLSKNKDSEEKLGIRNEKVFQEDMTGEDLDVPGSEADEAKGNSGKEDEENNYYSLGGDNHKDLEEDKGE